MRKVCLILVGASALALWGCGGGGGGPVGNSLVNGRAALTQLAANTTPASTQSLQSALTLFQQALQQDPNSSEAHFGAAVCLMGASAQQIDGGAVTPTIPPSMGLITTSKSATGRESGSSSHGNSGHGNSGSGFVLPVPPTDGDRPPAPPDGTEPSYPIEPVHTLGLFWFLDRGLSNPNTLLNMLAPISDLRLGLIPYYGYAGDAQAVTRRQQLLTDLATVSQHLQAVEADPNFTLTLPAPDQDGQPVTVGLPEVYLFDAYVQSLRASTALSLTYIRDPGTSGLLPPGPPSGGGTGAPNPPSPPIFSHGSRESGDGRPLNSVFLDLDKNKDGKLTPDEYLPPSPFLTLRDAAYFQTAQAAMQSVVDRETKGIAGVLARPAGGNFLLPDSANVQKALTGIRDNVLPLIQQATTGPVTLTVPRYLVIPLIATPGGPLVHPDTASNALFTLRPSSGGGTSLPLSPIVRDEKITLNIAAWFAHPPADLKLFAPVYTLDSIGYPDYNKTTYPDPTFGGLFPNGIPTDLRL